MTDKEILEKGKQVIKLESEAIADLYNFLDDEFIKAVKIISQTKGRVIITGLGKSGLIARKIVATFNSTGTAAVYLHPTDALHGDLGMVRSEDVLILISKSGNTEELVNLMLMLKRMNVTLIGMLGEENSKIGRECDIFLNVYVKEEACPHDLAPTSSSTAALVMGDALAITLLELKGFTTDDFAFLHPGGSLGKRLSLKISEIMYKGKNVPIVNEDTSLKDAILEMTSKRLGVTSVVDKNGNLTGVLTDGDLRRLLEKQSDIKNLVAKNAMSKNPKTIKAEFLASFALQQMENFKITSLVVVDDDNKPVGIIHLHDLIEIGLQRR
ncbi:arabinose 5-phosphate isomerase [hydrocarbon metagenome]|uniref:Arabinose 5-phosphate isomerase n=1 Tax=hydrocarbon metagenome TaxID=938273 RepID=A0A0W8FYY5_9ZZZZ